MISQSEVVNMILEVECLYHPADCSSYLNEGQQAQLGVLYSVLNRDLTDEECYRLAIKRKEALGEVE
jgi:hypothetical protein